MTRKEEIIMPSQHPLAGMGGKPILGKESASQTFVGRIVLELFESPYITSDANGFALIVGTGLRSGIKNEELARRVATALTTRAEGELRLEEITTAGPLANWEGKPFVGRADSDKTYVGRIIVELYEGPHITSDANGLVLNVSPAIDSTITHEALLKRVAAAFPARAEKVAISEEMKRKYAQERGGIY
jgi:hypothetical protein